MSIQAHYSLSSTWGRLPVVAGNEAQAVMMGVLYAARNGLRVRVVAETHAGVRVVAVIPPTWVSDTVIHLVLGHATPDVATLAN